MALGGFFKYDKPGPGIKKDAPKKKFFFVFLEIWARNIWKLIPVNLIYVLMSLLIIPGGLAQAGMTNVARNLARDKHSFGISDFFSTIRKNFKQALPAGIINNFITILLSFAIFFYYMDVINKEGGITSIIGLGLCLACFIVFSFMKYYFWLLVITFKLSLKNIYKNCFTFSFANLKYNLLISLVNILVYGSIVAVIIFIPMELVLIVAVLAAMILPGFTHIFTQLCIFPKVKQLMIDPYYAEHQGEDIELRRNLGLEIEEEDENIFDDEKSIPEE
ncbi:MAG: DUF624 domain-containing protein [Ruminococcaceae bacterium]|nr:DUF624 domain-containing protein [Oscillospiraceae bacterium]